MVGIGTFIIWILIIVLLGLIFSLHFFGYFLTSPKPNKTENYEQVALKWRNINYAVKQGKKKKLLLRNISGEANPGEIVAVMGSSGCGKTTLLNLLAGSTGRSDGNDYFSGQILFNGNQVTSSLLLNKQCCYVYQDDTLLSTFTVNEYLSFIASLLKGSRKENKERLKNVKKLLRIEHIGGNLIGNHIFSEISGGQRRRVSLAEGLLSDCKLLFLDEPTTGLSSADAQELFEVLQDVASTGCTIVIIIHQPRQSIFMNIDKLLLMSAGQQVYFGPANEVDEHFRFHEFPLPKEENSADAIIDYLDNPEVAENLIETWKTDYEGDYPDIEASLIEEEKIGILPYMIWRLRVFLSVVPKEIIILIYFHLKIISRNYWIFIIPCIVSLLFGILTGLIFRNIPETVEDFPYHLAKILRIVADNLAHTTIGICYCYVKINADLQLLVGRYTVFSTAIVWTLYCYVYIFISSVLSTGVGSLVSGSPLSLFFPFIGLNSLFNAISANFLLALVVFLDFKAAFPLDVASLVFIYATSGFYVRPSDMFVAVRWIPIITPLQQVIDAAATLEYADTEFTCDSIVEGYDCSIEGSELLEGRDLDGRTLYDYGNVLFWSLLTLTLFTFAIYYKNYSIRKYLKNRISPQSIENNKRKLAELQPPAQLSIGGNINNEKDKEVENTTLFLSNEEFTLAFDDISCFTADGIQILQNVCGCVKTGEILAVMGPSGSGKTTLLKCLSGIQNPNLYSNLSVYINNYQLTTPLLKSGIATFMTQDDVLHDSCTVRECLDFVSDLISWNSSYSKRKKIIDNLLIQLKLAHVEHSFISQISGGERKRVSLAQTFLAQKRIILLDEPTSGLSGSDARLIMDIISTFAKSNKIIVIITIHQPRSSIFMNLDHVLLMTKGYPVYYGPPHQVESFFNDNQLPTNPDVPNIADSVLDTILENEVNLVHDDSIYQNHVLIQQRKIKTEISKLKSEDITQSLSSFTQNQSYLIRFIGIFNEILTLSKFYGRIQKRSAFLVTTFYPQEIMLSIFYGIFFLQIPNTLESFPSITGSLFLLFTALGFTTNGHGFVVGDLVWFWIHDSMIRLSHVWTCYFVELLISHFRIVFAIFLFCPPVYFLIGYDTVIWKFLIFFLSIQLSCVWFYCLAASLMLMVWHTENALLIGRILLGICLSTSGFLLSLDNLPVYFQYFSYINPLRYINELIFINEFIGQTYKSEDSDLVLTDTEAAELFGYDIHAFLKDILVIYGIIFITCISGIIGFYIKSQFKLPKFVTVLYHRIYRFFKGIDKNDKEYKFARLSQSLNTEGLSASRSLGSSSIGNSGGLKRSIILSNDVY